MYDCPTYKEHVEGEDGVKQIVAEQALTPVGLACAYKQPEPGQSRIPKSLWLCHSHKRGAGRKSSYA